MREALARTDNDFVLSEPRRKSTKRNHAVSYFAMSKQAVAFAAKNTNLLMGVAFTGLLTTVLVNALVWQKSRHPAPLFGHSIAIEAPADIKADAKALEAKIAAPQPASRPAAVPQQAPAAPQPAASTPHGRDPMAEAAQLPSQKPSVTHDPIAQLLKSAAPAPAESSKSIAAAQRALMKLGYVVKPDGVMGPAFHQTLEQFERDHGLPVHGILSPKIAHQLSAESGISVE